MSTLICNAAEGVLQIVLLRDDAVLCAQEWPAPTRSTEILAPALAHMLQELGMRARDITRIACVNGPGSFTGIRLVLSTAAALRRALQASVAPVDYMEALALSVYLRLQDIPCTALPPSATADVKVVWVLTHARRNLVHCQPFALPAQPAPYAQPMDAGQHENVAQQMAFKATLGAAQGDATIAAASISPIPVLAAARPYPLAAVDLCSLEICAQRINSPVQSILCGGSDQHVNSPATHPLCVGSGLLRNQAYFYQHCPQAQYGGPSYATVCYDALVQLAQQASYGHEDLNPLYVRPCDAVENLPAMAQKLGQNPATAEQRLATLLQRPTSPDQCYRPQNT